MMNLNGEHYNFYIIKLYAYNEVKLATLENARQLKVKYNLDSFVTIADIRACMSRRYKRNFEDTKRFLNCVLYLID